LITYSKIILYSTGATASTYKRERKLRPQKTVKTKAAAQAVPKSTKTPKVAAPTSNKAPKVAAPKSTKTPTVAAPTSNKAPKAETNNKCPADPGSEKVTICHLEGGTFQTLSVDQQAAAIHLEQHEADYCGECKAGQVDGSTCTVDGYCCSHEDCSNGDFCIPDSHKCVACDKSQSGLNIECCNDSDCGDTSSFICEYQLCFPKECDKTRLDVECCDDNDCPSMNSKCEWTKCISRGYPRFTLSWIGDDDLDLHVITPGGVELWFSNNYDGLSNGYLDHDDIPTSLEGGKRGRWAENIKFPLDGSAPAGTYTFWVHVYRQTNELDPWGVSVYVSEGDIDVLQKRYTGIGDSAVFTFEK
jgi:hypothetical protein